MGYVNAELFAEQLAQAVQDPVMEVRKVGLEAIGYGWPPSSEKISALEYCLRDESPGGLRSPGFILDGPDGQ